MPPIVLNAHTLETVLHDARRLLGGIVHGNAERDPSYMPYCMRCQGLVRMVPADEGERFVWRCEKCPAVCDHRPEMALVQIQQEVELLRAVAMAAWDPRSAAARPLVLSTLGAYLFWCVSNGRAGVVPEPPSGVDDPAEAEGTGISARIARLQGELVAAAEAWTVQSTGGDCTDGHVAADNMASIVAELRALGAL